MEAEREIETLELMIALYCRKQHGSKRGTLCADCTELLDYARARRAHCPHKENKPFCSCCPIRCYRLEMREKIRAVMRFSGPRIVFTHPIMAFRHLHDTLKQKRQKKQIAVEGGTDVR